MRRTPELMREVNRNIRGRANGQTEPIPLFCECVGAECYGAISLTSAAFDAIEQDATAWIVIAGHASPRAPVEPSPWT